MPCLIEMTVMLYSIIYVSHQSRIQINCFVGKQTYNNDSSNESWTKSNNTLQETNAAKYE